MAHLITLWLNVRPKPPLVIPHPRLHERGFVLVPLMDVAPDIVRPVIGKKISALLAEVDAQGIKRIGD